MKILAVETFCDAHNVVDKIEVVCRQQVGEPEAADVVMRGHNIHRDVRFVPFGQHFGGAFDNRVDDGFLFGCNFPVRLHSD